MADKNIKITVADKRAKLVGTPVIVCGNSDYTVTFTFDDEWAGLAGELKTARFVYIRDGVQQYEDMVFSGDTVVVPVLADVAFVSIGVYMGNLSTTTPARVLCTPSILCGTGAAQGLTEDVYNQLLASINALVEKGASGATEEQVQQIEQNTQSIENLAQSVENFTTGGTAVGDAQKLGGKAPEHYATAQRVADIETGVTPAGDAKKLDGKGAENFALKEDLNAYFPKSGGTFEGEAKANANAVKNLGTAQLRNISVGTTELVPGTSTLTCGDIYVRLEV